MIAASGLLQGQGLSVSANLTSNVNSYQSTNVVASFDAVVAKAIDVGNTVVSTSTLQSLQQLGANVLPAVTNSIPTAYTSQLGNTNAAGFSGLITDRADEIMGNGDITKFAQIYSASQGYRATANQFITASNNTGPIDDTFINMDAITTGGLSMVSNDLSVFGPDLVKAGQAINPADLARLGYPSSLLLQLINLGGLLPEIRSLLVEQGVADATLTALVKDPTTSTATLENQIYRAMQEVTGELLSQVKFLMDITTTTLTTMADILDPRMLLPNSYQTLVFYNGNVFIDVYVDGGSVNVLLEKTFVADPGYQLLSAAIPSGIALANRAWSRGLFQVKNIINLTLPDVAAAASLVQNNSGLTDINELASAVPASVTSEIQNIVAPSGVVATATGTGNTFTLYDFVGTAAGYPHAANLSTVTTTLNYLESDGVLDTLTQSGNGAYTVMLATLNGVYGNISTGPITGVPAPFDAGDPYANVDVAFTSSYLPVTANLISSIVAANTTAANTMNSAFDSMAEQLVRESINANTAKIQINELQSNSMPAMMSIVTSLHDIGADSSSNGPSSLFTAVANLQTQSGQAVVASLREGRNIQALEDAGIGTDTQLPAG